MSAHLCRVPTMLVREAMMGPRILTQSRIHYNKWVLTSAGCWLCWWGRQRWVGPRIQTPSRMHYDNWVLTSAGCWLCWWGRQWWAQEYWHHQEYITINECSPLQGADYVGEGGNDGPQNTDNIKNSSTFITSRYNSVSWFFLTCKPN